MTSLLIELTVFNRLVALKRSIVNFDSSTEQLAVAVEITRAIEEELGLQGFHRYFIPKPYAAQSCRKGVHIRRVSI